VSLILNLTQEFVLKVKQIYERLQLNWFDELSNEIDGQSMHPSL